MMYRRFSVVDLRALLWTSLENLNILDRVGLNYA